MQCLCNHRGIIFILFYVSGVLRTPDRISEAFQKINFKKCCISLFHGSQLWRGKRTFRVWHGWFYHHHFLLAACGSCNCLWLRGSISSFSAGVFNLLVCFIMRSYLWFSLMLSCFVYKVKTVMLSGAPVPLLMLFLWINFNSRNSFWGN